jgi:hypothetical protein
MCRLGLHLTKYVDRHQTGSRLALKGATDMTAAVEEDGTGRYASCSVVRLSAD